VVVSAFGFLKQKIYRCSGRGISVISQEDLAARSATTNLAQALRTWKVIFSDIGKAPEKTAV